MTAVPQKDGRIKVGDVEILKQENTGTNTDLDGDAVAEYTMKYAMKYNNPNMKFVCITDDFDNACRYVDAPVIGSYMAGPGEEDPYAHLQGSGFYVYKSGPIGIDYTLLNQCKYAIITSSTFAFWPAWTYTKAMTIIAPKYWNDYKRSNGYWRGDDNIVDDWLYIDTTGAIMNGVDCKEEYREYRKQHAFYNDKPEVV